MCGAVHNILVEHYYIMKLYIHIMKKTFLSPGEFRKIHSINQRIKM